MSKVLLNLNSSLFFERKVGASIAGETADTIVDLYERIAADSVGKPIEKAMRSDVVFAVDELIMRDNDLKVKIMDNKLLEELQLPSYLFGIYTKDTKVKEKIYTYILKKAAIF